MSRIAWSRYSGEEIEHAIAMFVGSEDKWAQNITPSRGDGGIDILSMYPDATVYQIKSFTSPLTSGQKKQVRESLDRVITDKRWGNLKIGEWHLVTPWSPTPEAMNWLHDEAQQRGILKVVWDGLEKCDAWAAKYPQIVDYYFNGLRETVMEMADAFLQRDSLRGLAMGTPDATPVDIGKTLSQSVEALNKIDPHYSYGISTRPNQGKFPQIFDDFQASGSHRPVTSKFCIIGESEIRIDIFSKTNLSTELRPIEMKMTLNAVPGSPTALAIQDFLTYGTPLELPEGSADVDVDAPNGLGGKTPGVAISLSPHAENKENAPELRLLLLDSEKEIIDETSLEREYIAFGVEDNGVPPGATSKMTDPTGVLTVVLRSNFKEQRTDFNLEFKLPQNKLAVEILPIMRFLNNMETATSFVLAPRFGRVPSSGLIDTSAIPSDLLERNRYWYAIAAAITEIQIYASFGIRFPDILNSDPKWLQEIIQMGKILNGETLSFPIDSIRTHHEPRNIQGLTQISIPAPCLIHFPEGTVHIECEFLFSGILLQSAVETEAGVIDEWEVPDNLLKIRNNSAILP